MEKYIDILRDLIQIESAIDKNIVVKALIGTCELSRYIHIRDDIQLLVYGPRVTKTAHIVDEYVELDKYSGNVRIFKDTCLSFFGEIE